MQFINKLDDVLKYTSDKLIAAVKEDTDTALKVNLKEMNRTIELFKKTAESITSYDQQLKRTLNQQIKTYNNSINRLFQVNGWYNKVFWAGIIGSIATPILLIIQSFTH